MTIEPFAASKSLFFVCVQQSWTTLAGVSPVTVIASGSLGSDPLTIFLKKKDQK